MKLGLYDDLVTQNLVHEIEGLRDSGIVPLFGKIESAQLPDYLTRFLASQLAQAIRIYGSNDPKRQIELANAVMESINGIRSRISASTLLQRFKIPLCPITA